MGNIDTGSHRGPVLAVIGRVIYVYSINGCPGISPADGSGVNEESRDILVCLRLADINIRPDVEGVIGGIRDLGGECTPGIRDLDQAGLAGVIGDVPGVGIGPFYACG